MCLFYFSFGTKSLCFEFDKSFDWQHILHKKPTIDASVVLPFTVGDQLSEIYNFLLIKFRFQHIVSYWNIYSTSSLSSKHYNVTKHKAFSCCSSWYFKNKLWKCVFFMKIWFIGFYKMFMFNTEIFQLVSLFNTANPWHTNMTKRNEDFFIYFLQLLNCQNLFVRKKWNKKRKI